VGHWHGRHTDRDRVPHFYLIMLSIARIRSVEQWWNDSDGKTEVLRESVPVPLCPPEILYGPGLRMNLGQ